MTTVQLFNTQGDAQTVSSKALLFRPAVYGIFIELDQVLLLRDTHTQLLLPPGRIVNENEEPVQAIRHYFRELAGITPVIRSLLFIENQYRQENDQSWQLSALYYAVERPSLASINFSEDMELQIKPEWLPLDGLERTQFQFGFDAIQAGILQYQL